MKFKVLFLLIVATMYGSTINAQRKPSVRIAYIDSEYILQNIPEYTTAKSKLDSNVNGWKSEIENRLSQLEQKRNVLNSEKALLTSELFNERVKILAMEEQEILDYQQKRFGPAGDLNVQKRQLIQPLKNKIFKAVESISASKKYDFVFDKATDVVLLYSAERYNISDQVLRLITKK